MPWPTTRGLRILGGAEADLILGTIGMMVDRLVDEAREETDPVVYGIEWFDGWDVGQRLWLIEQITLAMFSSSELDSPAAMFDATIDAMLMELQELVVFEIEETVPGNRSWRKSILDARRQWSSECELDTQETDLSRWTREITRIGDEFIGVRLYQRAEPFRDGPYERTSGFLRDRGLPEDYLERIPPLRTIDQTQLSIDRIQSYVFRQRD